MHVLMLPDDSKCFFGGTPSGLQMAKPASLHVPMFSPMVAVAQRSSLKANLLPGIGRLDTVPFIGFGPVSPPR